MCMCMYVCMYTYIYIYIHTHIHRYTCVYVYIYIYVYIHICYGLNQTCDKSVTRCKLIDDAEGAQEQRPLLLSIVDAVALYRMCSIV